MNSESMITLIVTALTLLIPWGVWATVTTFKHAQEIALIKLQINVLTDEREILKDVRSLLGAIKDQMRVKETAQT